MEMRKNHGVYEAPLAESIVVLNEGAVLIMSNPEGYGSEVDVELEVSTPAVDVPVL